MDMEIQAHYRAKDLLLLFGIGKSTLYEWVLQQEMLPRPIKMGRSSIWLKDEVDKAIQVRKNARK